MWTIKQ